MIGSGNALITPGIPSPQLDGVTPVFLLFGADPRSAPGFDAPIGSIGRVNASTYLLKVTTAATGWAPIAAGGSIAADPGGLLRPDPGGAFAATTRIHSWGDGIPGAANTITDIREATAGAWVGGGAANTLVAVPMGFRDAINIIRVLQKVNIVSAAGNIRLGIYANTSKADPYPAALLYDSGALSAAASGWVNEAVLASPLAVSAGTYLWSVVTADAAFRADGATIHGRRGGSLYPILGHTLTDAFGVASDVNYGLGWAHTYAGGALPDPFPDTARIVAECTEANVDDAVAPTVFFGFQYQ